MYVQNLMNSLRDIRIFLGLVPKGSPYINLVFGHVIIRPPQEHKVIASQQNLTIQKLMKRQTLRSLVKKRQFELQRDPQTTLIKIEVRLGTATLY